MPGVIPLEDAQQLVTDRLKQHAQDALQSIQDANQPPLQNTQLPVELPSPQIDPNEIIQRLQQHAQSALDAVQQANQPPLQNVQLDPNEIIQRLQQHAQETLASVGQTLAPEPSPAETAPAAPSLTTTSPSPSGTVSPPTTGGGGGDLRDYARQAARKAGIDPEIFLKQIDQESGFNPVAKSGAGAIGIAQFMPETAAGMHIDPTDPYAALDAAAQLDAQNLKKYGGDYAKALAAYNAGPGNVDQYGGVPPFEETQRYVRNILGGAASTVGNAASAVGTAADTARGTVANAVLPTLSQFGDRELNSAEAYAACGPAAAVRFAQMFGRNPTLREAVDLAKNVGWTADTGMAGLQSESKLFDEMNIPHRVIGADWQAFAKEAQSGNPVTLSTPGHYFTADAYDPSSGAFHVGSSGTDLRGGKEWMTPAEMEQRMGPLQGGLAADNPNIPGTSPLSQGTRPAPAPANIVEQGASVLAGGLQQVDSAVKNAAQNVGSAISSAVADPNATIVQPVVRGAQAAADQIEQQRQQFNQTTNLDPVETARQNARAFQNGDWTALAEGTMNALPAISRVGMTADLSQSVSAGLTAAGVDPNAARVLGQVANVAGQAGLERALPEVLSMVERGGPAALRALEQRGTPALMQFARDESGALRLPGAIGREPLPAELGAVTPPAAAPAATGETFYHGTATDYPQVQAGQHALEGQNSLGPGHYLAKDPLVADTYAERAAGDAGVGANVRQTVVPSDLRTFDMTSDADLAPAQIRQIADAMPQNPQSRFPDLGKQALYEMADRVAAGDVGSGRAADVFDEMVSQSHMTPVKAAAVIRQLGYDGIRHIDNMDGAENMVVFPEATGKLRNAISGRQGGAVDPLLAARLGGTVAGGAAGYATTPEDASPQERIARTAAGAGAGLLATNTAAGFAGAGPLERQVFENLQSLRETRFPPTRPSLPATRGPIAHAVDLTKQSMLSNPATHIANVIGNTIELARQPVALTLGGRGADAVAGVSAVGRALPEAVGAAVSALRGRQLATLERPGGTIGGPGVGGAVKSSVFRALSASDAFTRTLGEYQGMAAEASRLLREAGISASDPQAESYLARHATDLYREGTRAGAQSVFGRVASTGQGTGVLDNIFRTYSNAKEGLLNSPRLRDQAAGALMDFSIPFSGVPVQMLQIGLNRLPVAAQATGAVRAVRALRAGNMGEAQRAMGETGLESMVQLAIAKNVADGNITGPDDPEHPNSVRLNGNWVSMNEWGAYALPMQIMASWADGYEKGGHDVPASTPGASDAEKLTNYYGPRFAAAFNASLKPFQQGIPGENLIRLVSNISQGGATAGALGMAQDAVNRITVPGAARFVENATDPVARDINRKGVSSLWEGTMANWPGLAQQLPAKIDPTTGEVLNKARSGIGTLVGGQQDVASPLTIEADRLHKAGFTDVVAPKAYPQDVTIGGAKVTLSPDEQRAVTEITGAALDKIAQRMDAPEYQNAPDPRKALMLKAMINSVDAGRVAAVTKVLGTAELRSRVIGGQRTAGQLNQQAQAPDEFSFFNPTSGDLVNTQRALAGSR